MLTVEEHGLQPLAERAGRLAQLQGEERQCLPGREGPPPPATCPLGAGPGAVLHQHEELQRLQIMISATSQHALTKKNLG